MLADDQANLERIVWIAAGNIKEEMREEAKLAEQAELDQRLEQEMRNEAEEGD